MTPKSDIHKYVFIYHIWAAIPHRVRGILFALLILSTKSTTERFSKLAAWDQCSNTGDPVAASGSPGTTKEAAQGLGPGPWPCPAPGAQTLAASFVVPGGPEAATRSPAFEYECQVANFEKLSVVVAYTKILKQLQNRHGHI